MCSPDSFRGNTVGNGAHGLDSPSVEQVMDEVQTPCSKPPDMSKHEPGRWKKFFIKAPYRM